MTVAGRPVQQRRRYTSGGPVRYIPVSGLGGGGGLGDAYSNSLASANAANEQRYQQLLSGYRELGKRAEGYLEGQGDSAKEDIEQNYRDASSSTYNTLVNRGFANSSLMSTMQQGNLRNMAREQSRVDEQVNRQKLEADMAISDRLARVIENRTDLGPNVDQGVQMAQQLGQMGAGGTGPYNMLHPLRMMAMQQQMMMGAPRVPNQRWADARARRAQIRPFRVAANPDRRPMKGYRNSWRHNPALAKQQPAAQPSFYVPEAFQPWVS